MLLLAPVCHECHVLVGNAIHHSQSYVGFYGQVWRRRREAKYGWVWPSVSLPICVRGYSSWDFVLVCGRVGVGVCSLRGLLSRLSSAVYCIPVTAPGSGLASRARHALVTRSHIQSRPLRKRALRHGLREESFMR